MVASLQCARACRYTELKELLAKGYASANVDTDIGKNFDLVNVEDFDLSEVYASCQRQHPLFARMKPFLSVKTQRG